jgi:hypothetical protein
VLGWVGYRDVGMNERVLMMIGGEDGGCECQIYTVVREE